MLKSTRASNNITSGIYEDSIADGLYSILKWTCAINSVAKTASFKVDFYIRVTQAQYVQVQDTLDSTVTIYAGNDTNTAQTCDWYSSLKSNQFGSFSKQYLETGDYFVATTEYDNIPQFSIDDESVFPIILQAGRGPIITYFTGVGINGTHSMTAYPKIVLLEEDPTDGRSKLTTNATYIGDTASIAVTKKNSTYTDTIIYSIPGTAETGVVATLSSATRIYWAVPYSILNVIPAGTTQVECTLTCHTFTSSGDVVGVREYSITLLVNSNIKGPTFSPSIYDTNATTIALTGNRNNLVKYFSNAYVAMNATPQSGTTVVSRSITNAAQIVSAATATFNNVSSNVFMLKATDSRGVASSATATAPMVEYIKATCNLLVPAPDGNGDTNITIEGNYFNGSFGSQSNTLTVKYRYYKDGETAPGWITVAATIEGNRYAAYVDITGLDYTQVYHFEATATDKLMTAEAAEDVTGTPVFDWSATEFNFNVPVLFSKGFSSAENENLPSYGTWEPIANFDATNETALGSYFIIGNLILANFYYQGTLAENSPSSIYFTGLPYPAATSRRWQSGGGNCSGWTALTAGQTFTGWNIENNRIYGRTNPAGTTSAGASGFYIGAAAGTFYASGTIMYEIETGGN